MAKKKKQIKRSFEQPNEHEVLRQEWMLRLKVSAVYIVAWLVVILWMTGNLPNPINARYIFQNSNAHWFINAGLAIIFVMIQLELGKRFKGEAEEAKGTE